MEFPTQKNNDRVARTRGPLSLWYSSATGGPPIDVAVPVTPEITPAVSSVTRFLGTATLTTVSTTTASTMLPTTMPSARSDTTASTQIPPRVPATRPPSAQDTPRQSVCHASLARISTGKVAPATSIDPGMSAGSSRVTTGAAIKPSPSPIPLCTNPPRATHTPAARITASGCMAGPDATGARGPLPHGIDHTMVFVTPRRRLRPAAFPLACDFVRHIGEQIHTIMEGQAAGSGSGSVLARPAWTPAANSAAKTQSSATTGTVQFPVTVCRKPKASGPTVATR